MGDHRNDRGAHRPEFPEALDVFFARANELTLAVGPRGRDGIPAVEALLREGLAARGRGDVPHAVGRILLAMERLAELVSRDDPGEGAMMRAMADQFRRALLGGAMGDAREKAEVMRERSGAVITPKKPG